jgi:hypothetical protein
LIAADFQPTITRCTHARIKVNTGRALSRIGKYIRLGLLRRRANRTVAGTGQFGHATVLESSRGMGMKIDLEARGGAGEGSQPNEMATLWAELGFLDVEQTSLLIRIEVSGFGDYWLPSRARGRWHSSSLASLLRPARR